jgi:hypothetical protein
VETPEPEAAPPPRFLAYGRNAVIDRQIIIHVIPAGVFGLFLLLVVPFLRDPCTAIMALVLLGLVGVGSFRLFRFLQRFAVHPACPHCGKALSSDLSWVCGFCDKAHNSPRFFSVFLRCARCGERPKAYRCHHKECQEIVYLGPQVDPTHCAYAVGQEPPRVRRIHPFDEWELEVKTREHGVKLATLEADYYSQMTRRAEAHREYEKTKQPPSSADPLQSDIARMLNKLTSRVAKKEALDKWCSERRAAIQAMKLDAEEEKARLADLREEVGRMRAEW